MVELQSRLPGELASLLLGSHWWLWYQPVNTGFSLYPSLWGHMSMVVLSFVIDSLYNLSERSVLEAILAHQASGTSITFLGGGERNPFAIAIMIGVAAALRILEQREGSLGRFQAAGGEGAKT